ncbi:hypothetical protein EX30DRAFT_367491 [Ascodesmis nigricans]|uniref:Uncharacterized protein n=1 Tax=Ascodesmis nigricans TaxID=341454 RepID=A0A4S2MHQ8_9PEZI|nr:hypothetical protein EX30DRAFT_367491 [Ascodesmis nigricans]
MMDPWRNSIETYRSPISPRTTYRFNVDFYDEMVFEDRSYLRLFTTSESDISVRFLSRDTDASNLKDIIVDTVDGRCCLRPTEYFTSVLAITPWAANQLFKRLKVCPSFFDSLRATASRDDSTTIDSLHGKGPYRVKCDGSIEEVSKFEKNFAEQHCKKASRGSHCSVASINKQKVGATHSSSPPSNPDTIFYVPATSSNPAFTFDWLLLQRPPCAVSKARYSLQRPLLQHPALQSSTRFSLSSMSYPQYSLSSAIFSNSRF